MALKTRKFFYTTRKRQKILDPLHGPCVRFYTSFAPIPPLPNRYILSACCPSWARFCCRALVALCEDGDAVGGHVGHQGRELHLLFDEERWRVRVGFPDTIKRAF